MISDENEYVGTSLVISNDVDEEVDETAGRIFYTTTDGLEEDIENGVVDSE